MMRSVDLGTGPQAQHRSRRQRRRMCVDQADRRAMECNGWRTMLDYTENLVRSNDGTLLAVVPRWTAEAERADADNVRVRVAKAVAATRDEAWARLRAATDLAEAVIPPLGRAVG